MVSRSPVSSTVRRESSRHPGMAVAASATLAKSMLISGVTAMR
jgi:hypothetical protein